MAELFTRFDFTRTGGVLPWLYYQVQHRFQPNSSYWKGASPIASDKLDELEELPPDTSRDIEAPEGSSEELEQLWRGELDPFAFLKRHRGKSLKEIDYQIFIRISEGKNSAQIGAELGLTAENVRYRIMEARKKFRG